MHVPNKSAMKVEVKRYAIWKMQFLTNRQLRVLQVKHARIINTHFNVELPMGHNKLMVDHAPIMKEANQCMEPYGKAVGSTM